jgi:hypothetical protein
MKYMLMIHQGTTPTPLDPEGWATLSEAEQQAVYADYRAINETPGVTPGNGLQPPDTATTVRVLDGELLARLGRRGEADAAYRLALSLADNEAERRPFERRLTEIGAADR